MGQIDPNTGEWLSAFDSKTDFVMNPDQYAQSFRNINPYSQQAANQLFGGNVQNFINQGLTGSGGGFNEFINNQAPALSGLVASTVGDQQNQILEQGRRNAEAAMRGVLDQGSQNNSLYSSFTGSRAQEAASNANLGAALQASNVYNQMLGNLYQTQLPLAQQQAMQQAQLAQGLLGAQASFGDQMFVNPDVVTNPSQWQQFWSDAQPAIQTGTDIAKIAMMA